MCQTQNASFWGWMPIVSSRINGSCSKMVALWSSNKWCDVTDGHKYPHSLYVETQFLIFYSFHCYYKVAVFWWVHLNNPDYFLWRVTRWRYSDVTWWLASLQNTYDNYFLKTHQWTLQRSHLETVWWSLF